MDQPVRTLGRGGSWKGQRRHSPGVRVWAGGSAGRPRTPPRVPSSPTPGVPSAPRRPGQARSRHQRPGELSEDKSLEQRGDSVQGGHSSRGAGAEARP